MALMQMVELYTENEKKVLISKVNTFGAELDMDRLIDHRSKGHLARYSIGHYNKHGKFVGPNSSYYGD